MTVVRLAGRPRYMGRFPRSGDRGRSIGCGFFVSLCSTSNASGNPLMRGINQHPDALELRGPSLVRRPSLVQTAQAV